MITKTIKSHYICYLFHEIEKQLSVDNVTLLKDPYYMNKSGQGRFMIAAPSVELYNKSMNKISTMISDYIHSKKSQKLIGKKKANAPQPLNIII